MRCAFVNELSKFIRKRISVKHLKHEVGVNIVMRKLMVDIHLQSSYYIVFKNSAERLSFYRACYIKTLLIKDFIY